MKESLGDLVGRVELLLTESLLGIMMEKGPGFRDFIEAKAEEIAREKWRSLSALTPREREQAEMNLGRAYEDLRGEIRKLELETGRHVDELADKIQEMFSNAIRP